MNLLVIGEGAEREREREREREVLRLMDRDLCVLRLKQIIGSAELFNTQTQLSVTHMSMTGTCPSAKR